MIFIYLFFMSVGLALQSQKIVVVAFAVAVIPLFIYLVIFRFNLFGLLTVMLIPLSIKTQIGGGAIVSFPGEALVMVMALFYLFFSLNKKGESGFKLWRHPITILILLDLTWSVFTGLIGEMPIVSLKRLLVKSVFVVVFYFFFSDLFRKKENLIRIWIFYGIGLLIPVAWTIYNHSNYDFSKVVSFIMPLPFFNDHTLYASCIAFILPVVFLLGFRPAWFGFPRYTRYIFLFVAFLFIAGIIFSFSRAAWLSIIASGIAGLLIVFLRFRAIHFFVFLFTGLIVISYFSSDIYQNIRTVDDISRKDDVEEHFRSVMNIQTDVSNLERINRWQCALRMFDDRPVTGFGPGTYQFVYAKYQITTELTRISTSHGEKGNAHSEYLMYLSETGLPGLIIFLLLIYVTITKGINIYFTNPDKRIKWLAFSIMLGLISYLIHGFFNSFIDTDKASVLFYAAIAAIVSIDMYQSKNPFFKPST